MGTGIRHSDEFKQEAVNQMVIHGYDAKEVSKRLGISSKSLYKWKKELAKPAKKLARRLHHPQFATKS